MQFRIFIFVCFTCVLYAEFFPDHSDRDLNKMSFEKEELFRTLAKDTLLALPAFIDLMHWVDKHSALKKVMVTNAPKYVTEWFCVCVCCV